ncbi:MAG: P-loop NTPase [Gemmatimonadaceae bacterium]|nr:P-loop NTPase [Gemmatimonadaceae bacterium]
MRTPADARPLPSPAGRHAAAGPPVVAIGAGKGGVGTSTVAALFAATVAADGTRVLLIDASQHFGGLAAMLGIEPQVTLADVRGGRRGIHELAIAVSPMLSLVCAGQVPEGVTVTEHQLLLRRLVDLYQSFGLVVIDAGASAASLRNAIRCGATRVLAVTAHDRIALIATYALVKLLHEQAPDVRVDVLANRVDANAADRLHEYLNGASVRFLSRTVPFAGLIPDDPGFEKVIAAGLGTDEAASGSPAALAVRDIGARLLADAAAPPFLRLVKG